MLGSKIVFNFLLSMIKRTIGQHFKQIVLEWLTRLENNLIF